MISKAALKTFSNDLRTYSKVCLQIPTKGKLGEPPKMVPFTFNESQDLVHDILAEQYARCGRVRAIILKARQMGMSTYTSGRFFRKLHLWPNHNASVIADELDRASLLFGMYDTYAHHLPDEMKPMVRYGSKQKQLIFDNPRDKQRSGTPGLKSGITVETAGDEMAGRAGTVHLAHLSEMSAWPNAKEVMLSVLNAAPDYGSEIIIESTARGVGNLFHSMWEEAYEGEGLVEGANGFLAIFIPWWWHSEYRLTLTKKEKAYVRDTLDDYEKACMQEGFEFRGEHYLLSEEQLAWRRQTIREKAMGDRRAFEQEYPATPEEAFIASGAGFFDEESIKKNYLPACRPPEFRGHLMELRDPVHAIVPVPTAMGQLRVWEMPKAADWEQGEEGGMYVVAADTASGRNVAAQASVFDDADREKGGRDFCSADVVNVRTRKLVAQLHARMAPEEFARQLDLLGRFYGTEERTGLRRPALLAPEGNHESGRTVVKLLKDRYRYPNLYRHRQISRRFSKTGEMYGFMTTVETRRPMLDNLAEHVRGRIPHDKNDTWLPNKDTLREMLTFVLGDDGKPQAQEGAHDDRVISLAIALFLLEIHTWHIPVNQDVTELEESVGSSPTGMFEWAST